VLISRIRNCHQDLQKSAASLLSLFTSVILSAVLQEVIFFDTNVFNGYLTHTLFPNPGLSYCYIVVACFPDREKATFVITVFFEQFVPKQSAQINFTH
jgi:hypothetical protein